MTHLLPTAKYRAKSSAVNEKKTVTGKRSARYLRMFNGVHSLADPGRAYPPLRRQDGFATCLCILSLSCRLRHAARDHGLCVVDQERPRADANPS